MEDVEEDLEELEDLDVENSPEKKPVNPSKEDSESLRLRFGAFHQPERRGIVDLETKEVLAEGDDVIIQTLANIIERLERIENSIGGVIGN